MAKDPRSYYKQSYVNMYRNKLGEGRIERLVPFFNLKKTDNVLEVGCGSGFLFGIIKNNVHKYVGIDTSFEFINECYKNFPNNKNSFICCDINMFYLKNKSKFDKIFLIDVTEHIYDDELLIIFKTIKLMLKKKGVLYIHTPNADFILEKLKLVGVLKQLEGHIAIRNFNQYYNLLNKSGYKVIKCNYLAHYNKYIGVLRLFSSISFIGDFFKARLLFSIKI